MKYFVVDDPIIIQANGILREDITKAEIRACFTDGPFEENDAYYGFESYEQALKFAIASGTDTLQYPIFEVDYKDGKVRGESFEPLNKAKSQKIKGVSLNVRGKLKVISGSLEHANPTAEGAKKIYEKQYFELPVKVEDHKVTADEVVAAPAADIIDIAIATGKAAARLEQASADVEKLKVGVEKFSSDVEKFSDDVDKFAAKAKEQAADIEKFAAKVDNLASKADKIADFPAILNYSFASKVAGAALLLATGGLAGYAGLLGSVVAGSLAVQVGAGIVVAALAGVTFYALKTAGSALYKWTTKTLVEEQNEKIASERATIAVLQEKILAIAPEDKTLIDVFGEKLSDAVPRYDAEGKETPADKKDLFLGLCYEREKLQTLVAQKDKAKHPELVAEIKADLEKQKFLRATA